MSKPLAIFDFDGTMISGDSIIRYTAYAMRRGYEPWRNIIPRLWQGLKAVCGLMSATEGKSRALSFLARMSREEQNEFNRAFCRDILMPRIFPKALERMEAHQREGLRILLVSASPDAYISHLKDFLPVDAIIASPTDERGRVSSSTRGDEKVRRVREWAAGQDTQIDWAGSFSYGNSANDLPVMRLTGHPVCVNPSRRMKKLALDLPAEQWKA
ncbi:MAG: HAD-IB family hydrolase [Clostridiales bacterium]|nr:HAD-IB family hydrolase [Clostridiales bacterium]